MRAAFINLRFILVSLLIIGLVVCGFVGWSAWRNRPSYLLQSAQDYLARAENARKNNDLPAARSLYESADRQLQTLLDRRKDPGNAAGHLTRAKVLAPLARLQAQQELQAEGGDKVPVSERPSARTMGDSVTELLLAAKLAPNNPEAHALLLDFYHKQENYDEAAVHAKGLIDEVPADGPAPAIEQPENTMAAAYFLVARRALAERRPDNVLAYVEQAGRWEKQAAAKSEAKDAADTPRWRTVALEAKALKMKSEDARKERATTPGKPKPDAALARLNEKMPGWLDRARRELGRPAPASPDRPAQSPLGGLSATNAQGLLDTVLLGVETAPSRDDVTDRAGLLLDLTDKMTAAGIPPAVAREAARAAGALPPLLARLPRAVLPVEKDVAALNKRVEDQAGRALEAAGTTFDPGTYLTLARTALQNGRPDQAAGLAAQGLKVAQDRKLPANAPEAQQLRIEAAWANLLQKKPKEAEPYLAELDKSRGLQPTANFLRGLGAVLDGRLDEGVRKLEAARASAQYKDRPALQAALAHAYMGQNRLRDALPILDGFQKVMDAKAKIDPADQKFRDEWMPDGNAVALDRFRCHLGLATRPAGRDAAAKADDEDLKVRREHFKAAQEIRTQLAGTTAGPTADALYVTALNTEAVRLRAEAARLRARTGPAAALARNAEQADGLDRQAEALVGQARKVLDDRPQVVRDDLRLVWADLSLMLAQPEVNPRLVASAALAPLGAGADMGVLAAESARLARGLSWQWQRAEDRLKEAAANQKDSLNAQMAWVRWLQGSGRSDQAIAYLKELEDQAAAGGRPADQERRRRLKLFGNALKLGQQGATSKDAEDVLAVLKSEGSTALEADLLRLQALALSGASRQDLLQEIESSRGRHEQSGQLYLLEGRLRMLPMAPAPKDPQNPKSAGAPAVDYPGAIGAFERALEFINVRGAARNGLFNALLGLASIKPDASPGDKPGDKPADKVGPAAAFSEAKRLVEAHPDDPAVLLAYAVTARLTDHIYSAKPVKITPGKTVPADIPVDGMEGALERLKVILTRDGQGAAAALAAANQWAAAGRPDRARRELTGDDLKSLPTDTTSLVTALNLAIGEEDWPAAGELLTALEKVDPNNPQIQVSRAVLAMTEGKTGEARRRYEELAQKHPEMRAGFLGLAALAEKDKDFEAARKHLAAWRAKEPDDLPGYRAEVRLLARAGQADKVPAFADAFLKEQLDKVARRFDEAAAAQDRETEDAAALARLQQGRPEARKNALDAARLTVVLETASGLQEGGAYPQARAWLNERARPLVEQLPEATRPGNTLALNLVLGSLALEQCRQEKNKDVRLELVNEAEQIYREVLNKEPNDLVATNNLAWLLCQEKDDAKGAVKLLEPLRKSRYGETPISGERMPLELLDTFGTVYRAASRNDDAVALFQQALQRYGKEPRVLLHLARSLRAIRKTDEAAKICEDALKLAQQKANTALDPERKAKLQDVAKEAGDELKGLLTPGR